MAEGRGSLGKRGKVNTTQLIIDSIYERHDETDYRRLFWTVMKFWGHVFEPSQIWYLPLYVVHQAIQYGYEFYQQDLHEKEKGTAYLTACFVRSNSDPKKVPTVKIDDYYFHKPEKRLKIPAAVANTIAELVKFGRVPEWLVYCIPRDEIWRFRKGRVTLTPRLWLSMENESVALFCPSYPKEKNTVVEVALIMDGFAGPCVVRDIDSGETFIIDVPLQENNDVCLYHYPMKLI